MDYSFENTLFFRKISPFHLINFRIFGQDQRAQVAPSALPDLRGSVQIAENENKFPCSRVLWFETTPFLHPALFLRSSW
jgi:hypothetical protein